MWAVGNRNWSHLEMGQGRGRTTEPFCPKLLMASSGARPGPRHDPIPIGAIVWIIDPSNDTLCFDLDCSILGIKDNSAHCSTARSGFETTAEIVQAI
jgi:hypothetical protein